MKIRIRSGVFETNSSSQHVFAITENNTHVTHDELVSRDYTEPNRVYFYDDKLHIDDLSSEYGRWPFEILYTFEKKLAYVLKYYLGWYYGDEPEFKEKYDELVSLVKEILPEMDDFYSHKKDIDLYTTQEGEPILHRDLHWYAYNASKDCEEYTYIDKNGEEQEAVLDEEYYEEVPVIGGIDHQSMGLLDKFLEDKGIDLKEFLTNKKYIIIIDGDELNYLNQYIEQGFLNMDFIKELYRKEVY